MVLALLLLPTVLPAAQDPGRSVVRLVNHTQRGNWAAPWDTSRVVESSGSGFVVDGGLVLTNAHVVSDSRLLMIYLNNDPRPHEAQVEQLGHDCDLALVRPRDPGALQGVPPLKLGGLPVLGSLVDTLGYPAGGTDISLTRGVVSRIEGQVYVHSGIDSHLAIQTDAAINPGSSGGPVLQDGRVVGVAFQNNPSLENVGFFIPMEVVQRFLEDSRDGRYDGYPDLGADTSSLENPAAGRHYGLGPDETGARVHRVAPRSSADGHLQEGDIILEVNGRKVANDGSVADGPGRIPFGYLIDRQFIGEDARLGVLRDGQRLEVSVPLVGHPLVRSRRRLYGEKPRYFVYGGLVFVPLCRETLETYGADWRRVAPKTLLDEFIFRVEAEPEIQLKERVVLLRRLDDSVNIEMAWFLDQVVERVNGRTITGLSSLIEAFERHQGDDHVLEFAHARRFAVLDRRGVEEANRRILEKYGIHVDRNP
jgi:S1-C subfamily serine protease